MDVLLPKKHTNHCSICLLFYSSNNIMQVQLSNLKDVFNCVTNFQKKMENDRRVDLEYLFESAIDIFERYEQWARGCEVNE